MRAGRHILVALTVSAAAVAACSGSTNQDLFSNGTGDGGSGVDGSTPKPDGGGSDSGRPDGSPGIDSGGDAGIVVHESPAPTCHDLTQRGTVVVPTATLSAAPAANPLTTLTPGLYVATSVIEYQSAVPTEQPQSITVDVTPTRYYYLFDTTSEHQVITLDWSLSAGTLTRDILCYANPGGGPVKNRIDASPNGYTIYTQVTSPTTHLAAIRYQRAN